MKISDWLRIFGLWAHVLSAKSVLFSWFAHGVMALPLVLLVAHLPWTAPGAVFFYREAEQVWHRFINKQGFLWGDHFMDVAVPTLVGWVFLH